MRITRMGIDGKIDWERGFIERAHILRGIRQADVLRAARALRVVPGGLEFIQKLKDQGYKIVLITGGPREVAESALETFGADAVFSNEFIYEDGAFTGRVIIKVSPTLKGYIVRELARKWGVPKENIVAFGDGVMDIPLLTEAGVKLGINTGGKLKDHVHFETDHFDEAYQWLLENGVLGNEGRGT